MALTVFGKALRKLRIDRDMRLKGVADALGISANFLAAVESGRKTIPPDFIARLESNLRLDAAEVSQLRDAADQTAREFKLTLDDAAPPDARLLAARLARQFGQLDERGRDAIRQVLPAAT